MGVSYRKDIDKWVVRIRYRKRSINYTKTFASKTLAVKDDIRVKAAIEAGTFFQQDSNMSLSEAIELYMETNIEGNKRESTIISYRGYIQNHILPYFKDKAVSEITKLNCDAFVKYLRNKLCTRVIKTNKKEIRVSTNRTLSNQTIKHILCLLGAVFEYLVDSEVIPKNPLNRVKKPKIEYKEADYLTISEVNKLLEVAKSKFSPLYYMILSVSVITGMRQGEVLALEWSDIDFKKNVISIDKTFSKGKLGKPKTLSSIRDVKIPQNLALELKKYKLYSCGNSRNLVFANQEGNYIDSRNMVNRFFKPCLRAAGLREIKWHELRHSCITILAEKMVNIKSIQKQVGHSSESTTLKIYTHATQKTDEQMIQILESAFSY